MHRRKNNKFKPGSNEGDVDDLIVNPNQVAIKTVPPNHTKILRPGYSLVEYALKVKFLFW